MNWQLLMASILTTLLETDGAPESSLYLAIGANIGQWSILRGAMLSAGLVTISGHYVKLTDKGRKLAKECNAIIAADK